MIRRTSQTKQSQVLVFLAILMTGLSGSFFVDHLVSPEPPGWSVADSRAGFWERQTGVPGEVVVEALKSGGVQVFLFGSPEEKHRFGKGLPTKYGQMDMNADHYLKNKKGWSEKRIHEVGHQWGFSDPWNL